MRLSEILDIACGTLVLMLVLCATGCADDPPAAAGAHGDRRGTAAWFTENAEDAGLEFVHVNGASGQFYYPEILPPGVGLLDYDNDGDLDVYVVQGHALETDKTDQSSLIQAGAQVSRGGRLFRNDLRVGPDGTRTLHFTDVTGQSGIDSGRYGLGMATGDIDNDGWVDLYLTNFGTNQMFRNNGDGTFSDVTQESRTANESRLGVSAAFLDYDRDGWLDLFVANNVQYTLQSGTKCLSVAGTQDYCPPQTYGGQPDRLYRNLGNGTFHDVSAAALPAGTFGPALGVATADFNGDGWIDIYVANDGAENLLWLNRHHGTFEEVALAAGAAVTGEGKVEASMGVDAGDFDNDGDEDLVMTELTGQGSNLYVNNGSATFHDGSAQSGVGAASLPYTGFGTGWVDFNNDGWLDILAVNGTVIALEGRARDTFPYGQRRQLLRNLGNGRFDDVSDLAGDAFRPVEVGRGAAFGDVDNDGDTDVLVGNLNGRLRLLINNIGSQKHWVGLRLIGKAASRDQLGARVAIVRKNEPTLWRRSRADGSYGSANDPRVLVGLGDSTEGVQAQVWWPSGRAEVWPEVTIDRWTVLKEGSGQ